MTRSGILGSTGGSPQSFQSGYIVAFTWTERHYRMYNYTFLGGTRSNTVLRKVRPVVGCCFTLLRCFLLPSCNPNRPSNK